MAETDRNRSLRIARLALAASGSLWGLMGLFLCTLFFPQRAEQDSGWWVGLDIDPVSSEQAAEAAGFALLFGLGFLVVVALHGLAYVAAGYARWGRRALLTAAACYGALAALTGLGALAEPGSAMPVYFGLALGVCGTCAWAAVSLRARS